MKEHPLLDRLEALRLQAFASAVLDTTKHQLRLQTPLQRDIPDLARLLIRQRVVMLEIGAETFALQGGPENVLMHGRGVFGPGRELVSVRGEFGLQLLDGFGVFVEENLNRPLALHPKGSLPCALA